MLMPYFLNTVSPVATGRLFSIAVAIIHLSARVFVNKRKRSGLNENSAVKEQLLDIVRFQYLLKTCLRVTRATSRPPLTCLYAISKAEIEDTYTLGALAIAVRACALKALLPAASRRSGRRYQAILSLDIPVFFGKGFGQITGDFYFPEQRVLVF